MAYLKTFVLQQRVFTAVSYTFDEHEVECVEASGEKRIIAVPNLVWISKSEDGSYRICHQERVEIAGVRVKGKPKDSAKHKGFALVTAYDGTKLLINKRLNKFLKDSKCK